MKILIYGAGVLGCNLARDLFRAGKEVTLLARGAWAERIRKDGLRIKDKYSPCVSVSRIPVAAELWRRELEYLKTLLEESFGADITEEKLRAACRLRNRLRQAKLELMELQKLCPPPANYTDLYHVIDSANFSFDVEQSIRAIEEMTAEIKAAYEAGQRPVSPDRKAF